MKKKSYFILSILIILGIFSDSNNIQAMNSFVKAHFFNKDLLIDNKLISLEGNTPPILNYNDRIYVPLRFIGDRMNSIASYDSKEGKLYIDNMLMFYSESKEKESIIKRDFELRLSSEKSTYSYGEPLKIWSTLIYRGNKAINITHGGSVLSFSIIDEDGYKESELYGKEIVKKVEPNDDFLSLYPSYLSRNYLLNKNKVEDLEAYFDKTPRPSVLPKGTYTIRVSTNVMLDSDDPLNYFDQQLTTEIKIKIE